MYAFSISGNVTREMDINVTIINSLLVPGAWEYKIR